MDAMQARIRVNIDARALKPSQLKEKRARAKNALAVTASGSESGSHQAAHVTRSAIVYDAGLGGAAAQPRARDADQAIAAARDAGAAPGAARLAGALSADRVRHGNRAVTAPRVVLAGGSANNMKEARAAVLANLDRTFQSMQQPKYTPAKRKSMSDVLQKVGVHARHTGANVEINGSENPYYACFDAQLRTDVLKFTHISDAGLASQVRDTLNAVSCAPHHVYVQALTAESLETSTHVTTLMGCADSFDLKTVSVRAALTQFVTELRRGNEGLQTLFNVRYIDLA